VHKQIREYYNLITSKLKSNDFKILKIKSTPTSVSIHQEALNYLLYEWTTDNKDPRIDIFKYVLIPNDIDFDFCSITFDQFFDFLIHIKESKEHDKIENLSSIEIIESIKQEPKESEIDPFWIS
jgi:hypothetical protein